MTGTERAWFEMNLKTEPVSLVCNEKEVRSKRESVYIEV